MKLPGIPRAPKIGGKPGRMAPLTKPVRTGGAKPLAAAAAPKLPAGNVDVPTTTQGLTHQVRSLGTVSRLAALLQRPYGGRSG